MINKVQKVLVDRKPEEKGGAIAEERFSYQKEWAICKLLELHSKEEDYLMVFEYHDDILILDSYENPTSISFYQIKTKLKGQWTADSLTKKDKSENSFLGKLYKNRIKFDDVDTQLNFVSNARYKFELHNPSHKSVDIIKIDCNDLSFSEKKNINTKIALELKVDQGVSLESCAFFHVSDIPISNSENSSIAALVNYFESSRNKQLPNKIKPLHSALINEIRRKSKYVNEVTSFEDLVTLRSFTREEFENILLLSANTNTNDLKVTSSDILDRLNVEGESMMKIRQFNRNSIQYMVDKVDIDNESIRLLEKDIKITIGSFDEQDLDKGLVSCANMILDRYLDGTQRKYFVEKSYVYTVILFQLYGNE